MTEFTEGMTARDILVAIFGPRGGPDGPLEEFLMADLSSIDQHVAAISVVVHRYRRAITRTNKEIRAKKREIDQLESALLVYWRTQNQPGINRVFSLDESKELRVQDPTLRQHYSMYDALLNQRDEYMDYLESLRVKVTLTPGLQGLWNQINKETNY